MKVIIAGSRDISTLHLVEDAVKMSKFDITEVVSGGARGVDRSGEIFAKHRNIPIKHFIPDWSTGKGAGPRRNKEMARYADCLVALWDQKSAGTKNMIQEMKRLGKPVFIGIVRNK